MQNSPSRLDWQPDATYVIGHQRPDTDAICSALGYAWLLHRLGDAAVVAARTGQPSEQARYVLQRFGLDAPTLLPAVHTTFGHITEPTTPVQPSTPLSAALTRLGDGDSVVPVINERGQPRGLVTPLELARAFAQGLSTTTPCSQLAVKTPTYRFRDRLSDHRGALLRSEDTQFVVTDETGKFVGMARQQRLLHPPRARLILVDHNELSQAVNGAEEAEIVGVLDHHRLGNPATASPIPFQVEPVGSTSTLVAEQCRAARVSPPREIAGALLSGLLSDTLSFRSPTATPRDRAMAEWLGGLACLDVSLYGKELLLSAPGLSARTAEEIVDGDRKTYVMAQQMVSIGQVEVSSLAELPDRREELLDALAVCRIREGHVLICLMVTDVVSGHSHLLCRGERAFVDALPFHRIADGELDLGTVVSRKKQLVPAIQAALEL